MAQRKSGCRWGQACPAGLLIAKSAEAEKAGATQHSAKQLAQSARRSGRPRSGADPVCSRLLDNVGGPFGQQLGFLACSGGVLHSPRAGANPCLLYTSDAADE